MPTEGNTQAVETPNNEKVTFTPEQQARIDEIVREAMGRAGREIRTQAEQATARASQLEAELAAAKAEAAAAKTPAEKKSAGNDVAALESQIAEMKAAGASTQAELERLRKLAADKDVEVARTKAEVTNVRKEAAIRDAASKVSFIDVNIVAKLTQEQVKYDETRGKFVVVGENGQERLNSAYEVMTLDEFYQEFASKNPFLVRSEFKGGVGSSQAAQSGLSQNGKYAVEQIFGPTSIGALANKLAMENPKEYKRLKEVARSAGLIKY